MPDRETFHVIDKRTGKEADTFNIALHEEWAKGLCYCDIEGFAIMEDGTLYLMDECGKYVYADRDRFKVVWDAEDINVPDKWISVDEALPEDGETVLAVKILKSGRREYCLAAVIREFEYTDYKTGETKKKPYWVCGGNNNVRWWRKLPEMPEEGRTDEELGSEGPGIPGGTEETEAEGQGKGAAEAGRS